MLPRAAHLLAQPGIFTRRGSLWVTILVRNPGKMPAFYGKMPVFSLVVLALFWT
jgi:hypothetical protein